MFPSLLAHGALKDSGLFAPENSTDRSKKYISIPQDFPMQFESKGEPRSMLQNIVEVSVNDFDAAIKQCTRDELETVAARLFKHAQCFARIVLTLTKGASEMGTCDANPLLASIVAPPNPPIANVTVSTSQAQLAPDDASLTPLTSIASPNPPILTVEVTASTSQPRLTAADDTSCASNKTASPCSNKTMTPRDFLSTSQHFSAAREDATEEHTNDRSLAALDFCQKSICSRPVGFKQVVNSPKLAACSTTSATPDISAMATVSESLNSLTLSTGNSVSTGTINASVLSAGAATMMNGCVTMAPDAGTKTNSYTSNTTSADRSNVTTPDAGAAANMFALSTKSSRSSNATAPDAVAAVNMKALSSMPLRSSNATTPDAGTTANAFALNTMSSCSSDATTPDAHAAVSMNALKATSLRRRSVMTPDADAGVNMKALNTTSSCSSNATTPDAGGGVTTAAMEDASLLLSANQELTTPSSSVQETVEELNTSLLLLLGATATASEVGAFATPEAPLNPSVVSVQTSPDTSELSNTVASVNAMLSAGTSVVTTPDAGASNTIGARLKTPMLSVITSPDASAISTPGTRLNTSMLSITTSPDASASSTTGARLNTSMLSILTSPDASALTPSGARFKASMLSIITSPDASVCAHSGAQLSTSLLSARTSVVTTPDAGASATAGASINARIQSPTDGVHVTTAPDADALASTPSNTSMLPAGKGVESTPNAGVSCPIGVQGEPMTSPAGSTSPQKSINATATPAPDKVVTTGGDMGGARTPSDEQAGASMKVPNEQIVSPTSLELVEAYFAKLARQKEMSSSPKSARSVADNRSRAQTEKKTSNAEPSSRANRRARSSDSRSEVWDRLATRNPTKRPSRALVELEAAKLAAEAEIQTAQNLHHGRKLTVGHLDQLFRDHEAKERRRYQRYEDSLSGFFQPTISSNPNLSGSSTKSVPVFTRLYTPNPRRSPSPAASHEDSKKPGPAGVAAGIRLHNEALRRQHEKRQQEEELEKKSARRFRQPPRSASHGPRQNTTQTTPTRPSLLQMMDNMRKRVKEMMPTAAKEEKSTTPSRTGESLENLPPSPRNVILAAALRNPIDVARNKNGSSGINDGDDCNTGEKHLAAKSNILYAPAHSEEIAAVDWESSACTHPRQVHMAGHPEGSALICQEGAAVAISLENFSETPKSDITVTPPENPLGPVSASFLAAYDSNSSETVLQDLPTTPSDAFPSTPLDSSDTSTSPVSPHVFFRHRERPQGVPILILPHKQADQGLSIQAKEANVVHPPPTDDIAAAPSCFLESKLETPFPDHTLAARADAGLDPVNRTARGSFPLAATSRSEDTRSYFESGTTTRAFNAPTPTRLAAKPLQRMKSVAQLCVVTNTSPLATPTAIPRSSSGSILHTNAHASRPNTPADTRVPSPASATSVVSASPEGFGTPHASSSKFSVISPSCGTSTVCGNTAFATVSGQGPKPPHPPHHMLGTYIPPRSVSPWPRDNATAQTLDGVA